MEIFVSYARPDQQRADVIAERLRQLGNNVWLDHDWTGGQPWWEGILRQLRRCDVAVAVLSQASLRSTACRSQRKYAMELAKPILPLAIEKVDSDLLPTALAHIQVIDYSQPDEDAAWKLLGAITQYRQQSPLPDPLPEPPPVPASPLDGVARQLSARSLTRDQQLAIIGELEDALAAGADPNDRPMALDLLARLEQRSDLLAAVDKRVRALRASAPGTQGPASPPWTPNPPPQPTSAPPGGGSGRTGFTGPGPQSAGGPRRQSGDLRQRGPATATASPHWVMAIVALICFFPLGIPAVVYASRTRTSLEAGALESARKSASRVKIFFWITMVLVVIAIASASH